MDRINPTTHPAVIPGFMRGMRILRRIRGREAPDDRADSSSEGCIWSKKGVNVFVTKGRKLAMYPMMTIRGLLYIKDVTSVLKKVIIPIPTIILGIAIGNRIIRSYELLKKYARKKPTTAINVAPKTASCKLFTRSPRDSQKALTNCSLDSINKTDTGVNTERISMREIKIKADDLQGSDSLIDLLFVEK